MSLLTTTDWFDTNYATFPWGGEPEVQVAAYWRLPVYADDMEAADFKAVAGLADLLDLPQFVPVPEVQGYLGKSPETELLTSASFHLQQITLPNTNTALRLVNSVGACACIEDGFSWQWYEAPGSHNPFQAQVAGFVFYLTGTYGGVTQPVLFMTTKGVGDLTVVHAGSRFGQYTPSNEAGVKQYGLEHVISSDPEDGFLPGYFLVDPGFPAVEGAHAHHVWLEPQRSNLIANPAFNSAASLHWRWNDTTTGARTTRTGYETDAYHDKCGVFTSSDGVVIIESNFFPTLGDYQSLRFLASMEAMDPAYPVKLTYGLVGFSASYTDPKFYVCDDFRNAFVVSVSCASGVATYTTEEDHGFLTGDYAEVGAVDAFPALTGTITGTPSPRQFTLASPAPDSDPVLAVAAASARHQSNMTATAEDFHEFRGMIKTPTDTPEMLLRIEATNCAELRLTNVLVDPHEGQFRYFDGYSLDTLPDDYRWMGASLGYVGNHYTLWYNNFKNVRDRLVGGFIKNEDGSLSTTYQSGLLEEWAPTGSSLVTHWDAVTPIAPLNWSGDAFYPIARVTGTPVTAPTYVMTDGTSPPVSISPPS